MFVLEVHLSFLLSLLLLVLNHVLDLLSSLCFDALILLPLISVHLLFGFRFVSLLFNFKLSHLFVLLYLLVDLLLNLLVDVGLLFDFHHLVLLSLQFLLLQLHVAPTLLHDVRCSFAGFIDFADCLQLLMRAYFAFFRFQKADAIAQQFQVFLSTLARHFGSN